MSTINLKELGFTKEELQDRVIDRICQQVMSGVSYDEDGLPMERQSQFSRKLNERVAKQINDSIDKLAKKHVLPNVASYIEKLCLEETNKWGEKKGTKVTFIEYLVKRAEEYMQEQVNYEGKGKRADDYNFRGDQTRITFLVHDHLSNQIKIAMQDAMKVATSSIAIGIQETVKIKLAEVLGKLSVDVKTK